MDTTGKHILFFDGDCLFCQKTAQILYRWDKTQTTYFTSLQGETASMLPPTWRNTTDTKGRASGNAVLIESCGQSDELRWRGANATLRALYLTRGPLAIFWIFYFLPELSEEYSLRFHRPKQAPAKLATKVARYQTNASETGYCLESKTLAINQATFSQ